MILYAVIQEILFQSSSICHVDFYLFHKFYKFKKINYNKAFLFEKRYYVKKLMNIPFFIKKKKYVLANKT